MGASACVAGLLLTIWARETSAFAPCLPVSCHEQVRQRITTHLFESSLDDDADDENDKNDVMKQVNSRAEEIKVEKARTKLEEDNTKSFLKRRPLKLPYEDALRWVQGNLGCSTKEEFEDLVENGNLRTPYIPKRPEEYYSGTRDWISWDHFLCGVFDSQSPSSVKPQTGMFD